MTANHDVYKETIDYIERIRDEIVLSFDAATLNDLSLDRANQSVNTFKDILLNKIHKDIVSLGQIDAIIEPKSSSLSCIPKSHDGSVFLESIPNGSSNHLNSIEKTDQAALNKNSAENSEKTETILFKSPEIINEKKQFNIIDTEEKKIWDLELGNRSSFYDNQLNDKISIYLADSNLIESCFESHHSKQKKFFKSQAELIRYNRFQIEQNGKILPDYIENALIYISKFGLDSVGIFRKSGVKSRIVQLKEKLSKKEVSVNDKKNVQFSPTLKLDSICVFDVADFVKTWFRDLSPHLLTKDLLELFESKSLKNETDQFNLWHLGDCHRYFLFIILQFFSIVSAHSKQNQMTSSNLAICLAPSLCECDTEAQIGQAQKCLQHCIENYESLFYLSLFSNQLNDKFERNLLTKNDSINLNCHSSSVVINAGPQDILDRLLFERHEIDPMISRWSIKEDNESNDDKKDSFEFDIKLSSWLPEKSFNVKRRWGKFSDDDKFSFELIENGQLYKSRWTMKTNGRGQTIVEHFLEWDLKGFSRNWYKNTFVVIHEQQLRRLASSFDLNINENHDKSLIFDV